MTDLQTIRYTRLLKQRTLSNIGRQIARLEVERARLIAEIVDLVEAERRRTRPDDLYYLGNAVSYHPLRSPFGGDGAA